MGSYNACIALNIRTSNLPYQKTHDTILEYIAPLIYIAKNSVGFKVVESCNQ